MELNKLYTTIIFSPYIFFFIYFRPSQSFLQRGLTNAGSTLKEMYFFSVEQPRDIRSAFCHVNVVRKSLLYMRIRGSDATGFLRGSYQQ
jgi:hypothetical protein